MISISEGGHPHLDFSQLDLRRTEKHPNINVVPTGMAQLPKYQKNYTGDIKDVL
jgi:hypothetical protein